MEVLRNQTRFSDFTRSVDAVETRTPPPLALLAMARSPLVLTPGTGDILQ
jgi:hypothetical protein